MNKIPKFRVWDKITKTIIYLPNVFLTKTTDESYINNLIIQQFTGLLDKNGKEIYEGDLMVEEKFNTYYYLVVFQNGSFRLAPVDFPKKFDHYSYTFDPSHFGRVNKIIGNIFENPELLK